MNAMNVDKFRNGNEDVYSGEYDHSVIVIWFGHRGIRRRED